MNDPKDALIADLRGQIRSCCCPSPVMAYETIGASVDAVNCGCLHKEAASNGPATDISTVSGQCAMPALSNTTLLQERDELREALREAREWVRLAPNWGTFDLVSRIDRLLADKGVKG